MGEGELGFKTFYWKLFSNNNEIIIKLFSKIKRYSVQPIPPMTTFLNLLPSEDSTNLKLQLSFQVFTNGFLVPMSTTTYLQAYLQLEAPTLNSLLQ